ncbi:MAG: hypothetical protein GTO40_07615 [Deltaproteobacteria bacterium]|nr:hypothetical protein [Deltaproteobacteria bacterium]
MDERYLTQEIANFLDRIPLQFRRRLENVAIVVEKKPGKNKLRSMGLDPQRHTLYGLYEGTPLPQRSATYPPLLPDKITIYLEPLKADFPNPDDLREQLRLTLIHEIAHYFGIDESEIRDLGY